MEAFKEKEKRRDNLFAALIAGVVVIFISYMTWNSWVDYSAPETILFVVLFNAAFFVFAFLALSYRFRLWRNMKPREQRRR